MDLDLFGCYLVGEIFATVFYLLLKFQPHSGRQYFSSHVKSGLLYSGFEVIFDYNIQQRISDFRVSTNMDLKV